uniref:Uncharacterized protein n=1 Tax=Lactuca sativa TaxID=4236 RepID=A0A9R1WPP2_LACSA|nr:hypothetical protein LSAT_V11C100048910 [Lactuca sativa]
MSMQKVQLIDALSKGLSECDEICYKDPVLKDQQWSAYIDRSPGSATYSQDCFHACVSGCGYKFDIPSEKVTEVHPNRPLPPPPAAKTNPPPPRKSGSITEDVPSTSA